jgi:transcription elongation factor GreA
MATKILKDTHRILVEKIESLNKEKRETALRIREAADQGDLKENAEYHAAREHQSLLVYKIQLMQSHAPFQIVGNSDIQTENVGFGNKVKILEEGKDKPEDYYILGPIESELDLYPLAVTYKSPFARAVIGKKVNETFILEIQGNDIEFTVTHIEKIAAE